MSVLPDNQIRCLLKYLRGQIQDSEKLSVIEDELRGEFGTQFLREPKILSYFPSEIIEILTDEIIWKLKIIPYTRMRMTQRGISQTEIVRLFERFLEFCAGEKQIIIIGAYTIFGKANPRGSTITLRIDVDEIRRKEGKAHTVTVFVGRGDTTQTLEISLPS